MAERGTGWPKIQLRARIGQLRRISLGLGRDATLIFWAMVLWDFGIGLFNNLWPIYIESLDANPFLIGLLIGGQGIVRIAMTLPSGIVADRASRRRLIVVATIVGVPAALIYGAAQTWWHLIPGLLLMALANFGLPALSSYIAEAVPATSRVRAFTLIYTIGPSAAFIVSPVVGGWLAERTSLRVIFFVSAGFFLAAAIVFLRISERPHETHDGPQASYRDALAVPAIRALSIFELWVMAALTIGITLLPNYLQDSRGKSLGEIGRYGSIAAIGSILLSVFIARSRLLTSVRGIGLASLAVGAVCGISLATSNGWLLAVAFLMRGGFMVAWSLFSATLGEITPQRLRGRAFALAEFLGGTGFGLAPFAAGALYAWRPGAPLALALVSAPALALAAFWIERRYLQPVTPVVASPAPSAQPSNDV